MVQLCFRYSRHNSISSLTCWYKILLQYTWLNTVFHRPSILHYYFLLVWIYLSRTSVICDCSTLSLAFYVAQLNCCGKVFLWDSYECILFEPQVHAGHSHPQGQWRVSIKLLLDPLSVSLNRSQLIVIEPSIVAVVVDSWTTYISL